MADSLHLTALTVVLAGLLGGCAEPPAPAAPLGTFGLDRPAMVRALEVQGIPSVQARHHAGALSVRLVFEEDGRFRLEQVLEGAKPRVRRGSWSREGRRITLFTEQIGPRPIDPPAVAEATLDGDRLTFAAPGATTAEAGDAREDLSAFVLVRR